MATQNWNRDQIEALVRRAVYGYLPDVRRPQAAGASEQARPAPRLIANISARHCHLDQEALDALFGKGAELANRNIRPIGAQ